MIARLTLVLLALASACGGDEASDSRSRGSEAAARMEREYWSAEALSARTACGPDQVAVHLQTVSAGSCPESLAGQEGISQVMSFFVDPPADFDTTVAAQGYAGFVFDGQMKAGTAPGPGGLCLYRGCMPIDVAAEGVKGDERESCLIVAGGTATPAKKRKTCPAAVRIAGQHRQFLRGNSGGECCYGVPAPVPP